MVQSRWPKGKYGYTHWVRGAELPTQSPQELIAAIKANKPATDDPRWKSAVETPPKPEDYPIWVSARGWAKDRGVSEEAGISLREEEPSPHADWSKETLWFSAATPYPELPEVPTIKDRAPTKAEFERDFEVVTAGEIQPGDWLSWVAQWAYGMVGSPVPTYYTNGKVYRRKAKTPAPAPAPEPAPKFSPGDRVKLVYKGYGDRADNPVWGGACGYVVGKVTQIRTATAFCLPVRVVWSEHNDNSYRFDQLELATEADEKLAKAWALPVPAGWRALNPDEKIIEGDCWIDDSGFFPEPMRAYSAIEHGFTVHEAFSVPKPYDACKFIRRVAGDTSKLPKLCVSAKSDPTSLRSLRVEGPDTFVTSGYLPGDENIQNVPKPKRTVTEAYIAGLQRKNEAQRKALAALHEKLARTQDELRELRQSKWSHATASVPLDTGVSCTATSPHLIPEADGEGLRSGTLWTPMGLLQEKNRLKQELEDLKEKGRRNLEIMKAALTDDEKFNLVLSGPKYAEFFAGLIDELHRKIRVHETEESVRRLSLTEDSKKLEAAEEQIEELTASLARKEQELEASQAHNLGKALELGAQKREIDSLKIQLDRFEKDQRTPLPDTIGVAQAGDRWIDRRTGVVWCPVFEVDCLRIQLTDAHAQSRRDRESIDGLKVQVTSLERQLTSSQALTRGAQSRLISLNEWLTANAVWKSVRLCDNNDTVEQKVEHLVACWKNQADILDQRNEKVALLHRAVGAVPGSTPESLVSWLESLGASSPCPSIVCSGDRIWVAGKVA